MVAAQSRGTDGCHPGAEFECVISHERRFMLQWNGRGKLAYVVHQSQPHIVVISNLPLSPILHLNFFCSFSATGIPFLSKTL